MIWLLFNLVFAAEYHLTQQQIVLEAQTLMASNMERLSLDPRSCKIPRSCSKRVRVTRDNLITLERDGILTHCRDIDPNEVLLESPQFWRQARITAQQAGLVPVEPATVYALPTEDAAIPTPAVEPSVVEAPREKPSVTDKNKVPGETKSCEVVHFNGRKGTAVVKRYLGEAECRTLCEARKHPTKVTQCYYDRKLQKNETP